MRFARFNQKPNMETIEKPSATPAISIAEIIAKSPDPVKAVADLGTMIGRSQMLGPCDKVEIGQVAVLVCATQGISVAELLRTYEIHFGKLTKKIDAAVAEFRKGGGTIIWAEDGSNKTTAKATFTLNGDTVTTESSVEQAQKAGWTRNTKWATETRSMLRARVLKSGIREIAPWIYAGEVDDDEAPQVAIDPAKAAVAVAAARTQSSVIDFGAMSKALADDRAAKAAIRPATPAPTPIPLERPAPAPTTAPAPAQARAAAVLSDELQGQLVALIGESNLPHAQRWLTEKAKWLAPGQSIEELPEKWARQILAKPEAFKAKLNEFIAGGAK